ncbi:ATP-binding cassette domain-containing protein [Limosilactobacillus mucosae]|uniref:ATP-binding cassette domain-containing protein n=1 Tax=Limosilactobacillus mucosae TaxID=97478 RepID=UPI003991F62F
MVEIVMHSLTIEADNGSQLSNIDLTLHSPNVVAFCSADPLFGETMFSLLRRHGQPTKGTIQINDQPLKAFRHPEKTMAMLDDLRFKDRWTIQRAIHQAQKGSANSIDDEQAQQILSQFGLEWQLVIGDLSQKQRIELSIILLLVKQPPVLLLDHATDRLLPQEAKAIWQLLRSYAQKTDALILMTSDNMTTMMSCADDIYYFSRGYLTSTRHLHPQSSVDCVITVFGNGFPIETAQKLGARILEEAPQETRFLYAGNIQAILPLLEQSTITDVRIEDATVADELMTY